MYSSGSSTLIDFISHDYYEHLLSAEIVVQFQRRKQQQRYPGPADEAHFPPIVRILYRSIFGGLRSHARVSSAFVLPEFLDESTIYYFSHTRLNCMTATPQLGSYDHLVTFPASASKIAATHHSPRTYVMIRYLIFSRMTRHVRR